MGTSSKELALKLRKLAKRQHGCFTAAQAIASGYADSVHLYHVKNGKWIRVFRGVYRFADAPATPTARCMAALLWTRNKTGKIQGFITTETTELLQSKTLTDTQPIQIGVPQGFRRSSDVPDGIKIIFLDSKLIKTLNFEGFPIQQAPDLASKRPVGLDVPDYYDWLDYQAVLCQKPS